MSSTLGNRLASESRAVFSLRWRPISPITRALAIFGTRCGAACAISLASVGGSWARCGFCDGPGNKVDTRSTRETRESHACSAQPSGEQAESPFSRSTQIERITESLPDETAGQSIEGRIPAPPGYDCLDVVSEWTSLASGLELGVFEAKRRSHVGDSKITVLRIDPHAWELDLVGSSRTGESSGRTAKQWCEEHHLAAAINAGMFGTDYRTHVGYLRVSGHVNSGHVNDYRSVAAFDPFEEKEIGPFRIFDLDDPDASMTRILENYASVVQNLRLIKRPGQNRWSRKTTKRWSEAALGQDEQGRILFMFSRSPFTMYEFNQELLSMDIGLVAAQHLEGGPEAQLYLHVGDHGLQLVGSYETSFRENDDNTMPWPVPNVLGIRKRHAPLTPPRP